jgi:hypothetical protein
MATIATRGVNTHQLERHASIDERVTGHIFDSAMPRFPVNAFPT